MNNHFGLAMALFAGICFATTSLASDWVPDDVIRGVTEPTATGDLPNPQSKVAVPKAARITVGIVSASSPLGNDWVSPETLQEFQAFFQLGPSDPKGAVAAPILGAQVTGTPSLKTNPRREISLDDQRGNDWWSDQPIIMTGTATQSLKITPRRGISLDDQRGNDWWSGQPVILTEK